MRKIVLLIGMLITFSEISLANKVKIIPDSKNVEMGEVFGITFRVESKSDTPPEITMEGAGLDILEKNNQGVSSTTTYINGNLSTQREYIIRYQVKANRTGRLSLNNIKVVVDGNTIRHSNLYFNAGNRTRSKDIFVKAEPSKTEIYMGEGIVLRYFLYYRVEIVNQNIKKFPTLSRFMKRYLQENSFRERIVVNGEPYERMMLYSSVLFPEKLGNLKIDPIVVEVGYPTKGYSSGMGSFGFGVRNYKKRTYTSETIKVSVLPLPAGAPEGFTGLVGEHDFELNVARNKYLVNEPVELKFSVEGEGNLENYEVSNFINNENFEAFENNANLETTNALMAKKRFNLTFLPRSNVTLPEKSIKLSYFNPETKSYETKTVVRPEIVVKGGGAKSFLPTNKSSSKMKDLKIDKALTPVGPYLDSMDYPFYKKMQNWLNLGLFVLILFFLAGELKERVSFGEKDPYVTLVKKIKKDKMQYSDIYILLDSLSDGKVSLLQKIEGSNMSRHAKSYFKSVLNSSESMLYGERKGRAKLQYRDRYFKEAIRAIKEDNKKSDGNLQFS